MTNDYGLALAELTSLQRAAVDWQDGAALVLAGPGSGKTRVLTSRIARLLHESTGKTFRILALTFTNKAADEMAERVNTLVPAEETRIFIGTFHALCSQILRQHGSHLGIQSDFAIYSQDNDRQSVLRDAIRRGMLTLPGTIQQALQHIDRFLYRLANPEDASRYYADGDDAVLYEHLYRAYEEELSLLNALDFNSLLRQTYRLTTAYPAIAERYRRTYAYWLIDEFQDTNTPQYRLIKALAGTTFKNVFVVADDDQIIYEWNGASYRQIERFRSDFYPELIQLPTNFRCPPSIVAAANQLVGNNHNRTPQKAPLVAAKAVSKLPPNQHVRFLPYMTDADEAVGIAALIAGSAPDTWGRTLVLARTRALLESVLPRLKAATVPAVIAQRRDQFLTPEYRWLQCCLRQIVRPNDKNNFVQLVNAYNKMTGLTLNHKQLLIEAEQDGKDNLAVWADCLQRHDTIEVRTVGEYVRELRLRPDRHQPFAVYFHQRFRTVAQDDPTGDLADDCSAWQELTVCIAQAVGREAALDHVLQQLDLRSKQPTPPPDTVLLMTIHGAKGAEADYVYVIGMAEDNIPSFQSIKKGDDSTEMEEERRNCFVAITRTKEQLTLSAAKTYRGWEKKPSRFLTEMGLLPTALLVG